MSLPNDVRGGSPDLGTIADWVSTELELNWERTWLENTETMAATWERAGEPAYGVFTSALFRPIQRQLLRTGIACSPNLPGSLSLSEERWGGEEHRERRMWVILHRESAGLGAIVTRFFHDHTRLRLPEPPTVVGLAETDNDRIRVIVKREWPSRG